MPFSIENTSPISLSLFPQTSTTEGSSLLSDLTSELASFGELGSLLDSFGDFTKKPATTSTQPPRSTAQPMADRTGPLTGSSGSSTDRSSVTLVGETKATAPPASSPPSSTSHSRGSPAKCERMPASATLLCCCHIIGEAVKAFLATERRLGPLH